MPRYPFWRVHVTQRLTYPRLPEPFRNPRPRPSLFAGPRIGDAAGFPTLSGGSGCRCGDSVLGAPPSCRCRWCSRPAAGAQGHITSPKEFFGHNIGDDYFLPNYDQFMAYWKKIDGESNRMQVDRDRQVVGRTSAARGDHHVAGELQAAAEVQGHLDEARQGRGTHRCPGARAGQGRQGRRLDRRRPARHRSPRRAIS